MCLFDDHNLHTLLRGSAYEHVVVTAWMNQIVDKMQSFSDLENEYLVYFILNFIDSLDIYMKSYLLNEHEYKQYMTSYIVGILIPVIRSDSTKIRIVFKRISNALRQLYLSTNIYLLLYLEFWYCENPEFLSENFEQLLNELHISYALLQQECETWDWKFAFKLWEGWICFRDSGDNILFTEFIRFCNDVDLVLDNNPFFVQSFCMQRLLWIIGGNQ